MSSQNRCRIAVLSRRTESLDQLAHFLMATNRNLLQAHLLEPTEMVTWLTRARRPDTARAGGRGGAVNAILRR